MGRPGGVWNRRCRSSCRAAMGRGTPREASGGGAATSRHWPLRQCFALPPPHGFATGRIKGRSRPLPRSTHRTLLPRRGALLTDRLELAVRLPLGPARRARELVADAIEDIDVLNRAVEVRSEDLTSELQSLMRISYAAFCLNKNTILSLH